MSYDLAVFEKSRAPAETQRFLAWYAKQTEWGGDQDYSGRVVPGSKCV